MPTVTDNPETSRTDRELTITRTFDAPRELVFKAWTDPKQWQLWMGSPEMKICSLKMDLRVGGRYRLQLQKPDGEYFTAVGQYREINPPEKLVLTWDWEKDGGGTEFGETDGTPTVITLEFHRSGEQTRLVLKQQEFASPESCARHYDGWQVCLGRLGNLIETK